MAIRQDTISAREIQAALSRFKTYLYGELRLNESTIENYVGVLKRAIPVIGLKPTTPQARNYLSELRQKGDGYSHLTVTAVGLERYLKSIGRRDYELPRPRKPNQKEIEPLSEVEVALIIRACQTPRQKAMFALLAYSGIRNLELCQMQIGDVDTARQMVTVQDGKGGVYRQVNIAGECAKIIAAYLNDEQRIIHEHRSKPAQAKTEPAQRIAKIQEQRVDHMELKPDRLLFLSVRHGEPLEPQDVRKATRAAARRAGVSGRVWPHLFRHSLACSLVDRGANVFTVQHQLGHRHMATTLRYLHPTATQAARQYHACVPRYGS